MTSKTEVENRGGGSWLLCGIATYAVIAVLNDIQRWQRQSKQQWNARDEVDVAVEDSFPASDPPAWTAGRETGTAAGAAAAGAEV